MTAAQETEATAMAPTNIQRFRKEEGDGWPLTEKSCFWRRWWCLLDHAEYTDFGEYYTCYI